MKRFFSLLMILMLVFSMISPTQIFANQDTGGVPNDNENGNQEVVEGQIIEEELTTDNSELEQESIEEVVGESPENDKSETPPASIEIPNDDTGNDEDSSITEDLESEEEALTGDEKQDSELNENVVEDKEESAIEPDTNETEKANVFSTFSASTVEETTTSRLGHLRRSGRIYSNLNDLTSYTSISDSQKNKVYYVKKQANVSGERFYLISNLPSSIQGTIGWVKEKDLDSRTHKTIDNKSKTYYVKGTGKAYSKTWGGSKDLVYNSLSNYKHHAFKVNLTESVGNNTWYRGTLNGKNVWLHSSYVESESNKVIKNTSRLGHLRSTAKIYSNLDNLSSYKSSDSYKNAVYYVKNEANVDGTIYYLISKSPSSTKGTIGWVKSSELDSRTHKTIDNKSKTFYVKGTGKAYSKTWGGSKDLIYSNLSNYKYQTFKVNLTEKVGNNTWYRGTLNGESVWLHSSYLVTKQESRVSRLGHLRGNAKIYPNLHNQKSFIQAKNGYTHAVYYVKKKTVINKETFYLISRKPSSEEGTIGWVNSNELDSRTHKTVNNDLISLYIKGTGSGYTKTWGGSKNLIIGDMSLFTGQLFNVNLTETVGNNTWYRGNLNGKSMWLHEAYLDELKYSNFNFTLEEALKMQLAANPQTDKYRNKPAYISSSHVNLGQKGLSGLGYNLNLRVEPTTSSKVQDTVGPNTTMVILGTVKGENYDGSTNWYKVLYDGKESYAHQSLVNEQKTQMAIVTVKSLNVRADANANSHKYGSLSEGAVLEVRNYKGSWLEIPYSTWRTATATDLLEYLDPLKNDVFQHLDLSSPVGATAEELNVHLKGKGVLEGMGQAFVDAARMHNINELYLVSHALLETGNGTSNLAKGIKVNNKVVYNMFGINAFDRCPDTCGSERAYEEGWDTPYKAIVGGAKFIGEDYIYNDYNQNTLYKMRWNPEGMQKDKRAIHQYATDIEWSSKQVTNLKKLHEDLLDNPLLNFNIVSYRTS